MTTSSLPYPMLRDFNIRGKKVFIRLDLNVPKDEQGRITDDARLKASLPTITQCLKAGGKVMIASHLGRPVKGQGYQEAFSLRPIARWLSDQLNTQVPLINDGLVEDLPLAEGKAVLLENLRFYDGESDNHRLMAARISRICDIFVFDAFGVSHRAAASTEAAIRLVKQVCFGPLMEKELINIHALVDRPSRPFYTVCGGTKVSDKLLLLANLLSISDKIFVGGAMANTFLAAKGWNIGKSLYEPSMIEQAKALLGHHKLILPDYVVVAPSIDSDVAPEIVHASKVQDHQMILDLSPRSFAPFEAEFERAGTVVWNGPMGVFEKGFSQGTQKVISLLESCRGYTVAGGGDTNAALAQLREGEPKLSYVSTGGGAFLAALEGAPLASVSAMQSRNK